MVSIHRNWLTLKWFNLTPVLSGDRECSMFDVKPYARKRLSAGNDFFDVYELKPYPQLNRIALKGHSRKDSESRHVPRNPTVGVL